MPMQQLDATSSGLAACGVGDRSAGFPSGSSMATDRARAERFCGALRGRQVVGNAGVVLPPGERGDDSVDPRSHNAERDVYPAALLRRAPEAAQLSSLFCRLWNFLRSLSGQYRLVRGSLLQRMSFASAICVLQHPGGGILAARAGYALPASFSGDLDSLNEAKERFPGGLGAVVVRD